MRQPSSWLCLGSACTLNLFSSVGHGVCFLTCVPGSNFLTVSLGQAGTPYYTAPEMISREPYSYPADCWSFGVIVHQLLALERPFEGGSTAELVKAILSADLPPLPAHYSDDIK